MGERKCPEVRKKKKCILMFWVGLFLTIICFVTMSMWDGLKQELFYEFTQTVYSMYMPLASMQKRDYARIMDYANSTSMNWPKQLEEDLYRENHLKKETEESENMQRIGDEIQQQESTLPPMEEIQPQAVEEGNTASLTLTETKRDEACEKKQEITLEELENYETLLERFYTVDSNTVADSNQLNALLLAQMDMTVDSKVQGPQILIYHTHSKEGFADSKQEDIMTGIVGVGEVLSSILEKKYGYQVLHHMGQYDKEKRDDAYSKALPEIQKLLKENPSIQVVIDLHRDEMPNETRLVMELDGKPTARFMFFNGLSKTKKTGDLDYLKNEYQQENLAFSFQMKRLAEEYYPGLTRKNYLKGYRYNMHLCPKSLLVELGAQNNTYEEAVNACEPLAHLLHMVLSGNG